MRKKVLHIIDTGGPGGAETVFVQVASGLQRFGFDSTAVVGRDDWLAGQLRSRGIEPLVEPAKGSFNVEYLRSIVTLIGRQRPAALITHLLGPAIYGSLASLWSGVPLIAVLHGQTDLGRNERFRRAKAAIIRRGARRIVFVSEALRRDLVPRLGLESDNRCFVIHNGVDVDRIDRATPARLKMDLSVPEGCFLFGAVGNLRQPKSYDVLLRAARLAVNADPKLAFVVVGDNRVALYQELLELRSQLKLDRHVHFLGLRQDVAEIMKALDAYVLCSSTEGFSITCCEAMAAGVPVLSTRSGGPESILDNGRCGLLVPTGDPAALADGMLRLAHYSAERDDYARAAKRRVAEYYSEDVMLAHYSRIVESVTSV